MNAAPRPGFTETPQSPRLALGSHPPRRDFGVAVYVDFAATPADWAIYHHDWATPAP